MPVAAVPQAGLAAPYTRAQQRRSFASSVFMDIQKVGNSEKRGKQTFRVEKKEKKTCKFATTRDTLLSILA
jgi:hypothetical protein